MHYDEEPYECEQDQRVCLTSAVYDLKAVNPNAKSVEDTRTPVELTWTSSNQRGAKWQRH